MDNQWNYYRILQVQPDAPFEVIRHNYLLLLKTLRLHPDLGGSEKDTRLVNIAYETLSDPVKRARYDRELMLHANIKSLSLGPLDGQDIFSMLGKRAHPPAGTNRRNYYRILGIHPEADPVVIRERYMAMRAESQVPRDLLDAAYSTLNHPAKRREYDRLLQRYDHAAAIRQMQGAEPEAAEKPSPDLPVMNGYMRGYTDIPRFEPADPLPAVAPKPVSRSAYPSASGKGKPVSCPFCNTPHRIRELEKPVSDMCGTCISPLF